MRQGDAGMYHHRYKETQKGIPDTERHHSRIHSIQKIAVNHIPNYSKYELYPKLYSIFCFPQEGTRILSLAGCH